MKKFFVLVKKEVRELITIQMILPLVIMAIMFSFLGDVIANETKKMSAAQPLWLINNDQTETSKEIYALLEGSNFKLTVHPAGSDVDLLVGEAKEQNVPIILVVPSGFGKAIDSFQPGQIKVYKIISSFSMMSYGSLGGADRAIKSISNYFSNTWIEKHKIAMAPELLKNPVMGDEFVIVGKKQANVPSSLIVNFMQKQTAFIPIILFMVIILAAQMVAMAVANEKENKTLETLLSLPISRKTIVFAKLFGSGLVAVLFSVIYMLGFKNYMSSLTGGSSTAVADATTKAMEALGVSFGPAEYALLGVSLFLSILVALAIAMILGILAENVKSVQMVITPLMILVLIPYFLVLFLDLNTMPSFVKYLIYAIPFAHPFFAVQKLILKDYWFIVFGIIYQAIVFVSFVVLAAKIFSSDKIMTLKLNFSRKK